MTVAVQTPINQYVGNGSTTVFPYTFKTVKNTDIRVYVSGILITAGYSVSGVGNDTGGNITFTIPPVSGVDVTIKRYIALDRTTDYLTAGPLDANTLDADLDRVVLMAQDLRRDLGTGELSLEGEYVRLRTGGSVGAGIPATATDTTLLWSKTNTGEPIYSTPIYVPDFTCSTYSGPVYIYQSWDWWLYVVNANDGSTVWRYAFGAENYGKPQYIKNGSNQYIFGASHEGYVYCLDQDGNKLWHFANLYFRENTGTVTYNGSGNFTDSTKSWATNSFIRSTSAGSTNGRLNVTVSGTSYALEIKSCSGTGISVYNPPVGLVNGNTYSYSITPRYTSDIFYQHAGTAVIESGNVYLYVTGFDAQVVKLDISGNIVWKYSTFENIEPYPLVTDINNDGQNEVIVSSVDGKIYILSQTGSLLGSVSGGEGFDSFVTFGTVKGGTTKYIVSGCRDGRVYSINGSTYTLANRSTEFTSLAGNDIDSGCALFANGDGTYNIIMVGDPGILVMFDPDLNVIWRINTGLLTNSTPKVVTVSGINYIAVSDMAGAISFYSEHGELMSQFHVAGGIEGTVHYQDIDSDGKIEALITTIDGNVFKYRINAVDTALEIGSNSAIHITNNTESTSTTTGALTVVGGVGVGGNVTAESFAGDASQLTNIFPEQTGNSGKYLTTNGTNVSWATVSGEIGGGGGSSTWDSITGKPTTLAGYGITDAASTSHTHTGTYQPVGSYLTGNQTITISGDVTGSGATAITATLSNTGTAGTYTKVTTDSKGRVTSGTTLSSTDIPSLDWSKITTGKPTSLSGYGITDNIDNLLPTQTGNSGKYLTTNGTVSSWASISGGASTLDALTDVTLTSPTTGQALTYDGTNWVNSTISGSGGGDAYLGNNQTFTGSNSFTQDIKVVGFDTTGGQVLGFTDTTSAVNYLNIKAAVTNGAPSLSAVGSDTNIPLNIASKGTGLIYLKPNNANGLAVNAAAGSVNYTTINGFGTGTYPQINFTGTDTNVGGDFITQGNAPIRFATGTMTNRQMQVINVTSAVNYIELYGATTGGGPVVRANGTDTNVPLQLASKGTGAVIINTNTNATRQCQISHTASAVNYLNITGATSGNSPIISAAGSDTNVGLALSGKGSGDITLNGYSFADLLKFEIAFQLQTGADGTFTISESSSLKYTINSVSCKTDSGTISADIKINGTSVTGLSALSISSTTSNATASGANTVNAGNRLTVVTSSNSSAANLIITIKCTRIV